MNNRPVLISGTILTTGILFSLVLWTGIVQLMKFNAIFQFKDFAEAPYSQAVPSQTLRLNDRQFVIVSSDEQRIAVYNVDAQGKLTRVSDNDVRTQKIQPNIRPAK